MPAEFLDRIDDSETVAPIGSLAGAEDTVLLAAAKSGSGHAFEVLIERHARRILCAAQRLTGNREDGEDIVQQSFQKVFAHLQKFEGRSSFRTWLTRIAINEVLMSRRKNIRASAASLGELNAGAEAAPPLQISDSGPSPERSNSEQEREQILSFAMNQLKPPVRTAFQLCELDERTLRESAQMMGLMFGSKTLQINAEPNGNSLSLAAHMVRAKANGGCHGGDLIDRCAGGFGVSVPRRPRRRDWVEASSVNRACESSGRTRNKSPRRAPTAISSEGSL